MHSVGDAGWGSLIFWVERTDHHLSSANVALISLVFLYPQDIVPTAVAPTRLATERVAVAFEEARLGNVIDGVACSVEQGGEQKYHCGDHPSTTHGYIHQYGWPSGLGRVLRCEV